LKFRLVTSAYTAALNRICLQISQKITLPAMVSDFQESHDNSGLLCDSTLMPASMVTEISAG
jgi:hypothetical protein